MPLRRNSAFLFKVVVLMAAAVACQPKIGDDCTRGTDCSTSGTRTCDTTMPGGYCTVANCEADTCPEEAACIAFTISPATTEECIDIGETRALRTFCMKRCSSQDDCRGGYQCIDLNSPHEGWGSQRVDRRSQDGRVCALPYLGERGTAPRNADGAAASESGGNGLASVSYCSATARDSSQPDYYGVGGSGAGYAGAPGTAGAAGGANEGVANGGAAGAANEGVANGGAAGAANEGVANGGAAGVPLNGSTNG